MKIVWLILLFIAEFTDVAVAQPSKTGTASPGRGVERTAATLMAQGFVTAPQVGYGTGPVVCSADGRQILIGSELWDVATGRFIRAYGQGAVAAAFSQDGRYVLTGIADQTRPTDGSAELWDAATGQHLRTFKVPEGGARSVTFSHDGTKLLTGSAKTTRLWNVATGDQLQIFQGHDDRFVKSLAFSLNDERVSTASDETAELWDAATGRELQNIPWNAYVTAIAFSPDATKALIGTHDGTVLLRDITTGQETFQFHGHSTEIRSVAFSPDSNYALSSAYETAARLWDLSSGTQLRAMEMYGAESLALCPENRAILGSVYKHPASLWDVKTGQQLQVFENHSSVLLALAFSPDGQRALSVHNDKTARLWDVATGSQLRVLTAGRKNAAFSPDGGQVLIDTGLWDVATGRLLRVLGAGRKFSVAAEHEIKSITFSPDGRRALMGLYFQPIGRTVVWMPGFWDTTALLWDVVTGEPVRAFGKDSGGAVGFTPDGERVLTETGDAVQEWDAATGAQLLTFAWDPNAPYRTSRKRANSVHFSPDGRQVIGAFEDGTAQLWDIATGKPLHVLECPYEKYAWQVASFLPDGKRILTVCADKIARLWDVSTGQQLNAFDVGVGEYVSLAFSKDGHKLLIGSYQQAARLWEIPSGKAQLSFYAFSGGGALAIDASGAPLAVSGPEDDAYVFVRGMDVRLPTTLRLEGYTLPAPMILPQSEGR